MTVLVLLLLSLLAPSGAASAEEADGATLHRGACASCHGSDGSGAANSAVIGPLCRNWWPTLEFEALQNVTQGEETFLLTPQVYEAIRKRGHVALALGVQVPVAGEGPFDDRIVGILLWESLDGGLWW